MQVRGITLEEKTQLTERFFVGNWGDDFPAAEDWDNDEYTGSLSDTKVFTASGVQPSQAAVGQPVNCPSPVAAPAQPAAPANNSFTQNSSYSQPIDLSALLQVMSLDKNLPNGLRSKSAK